MRQRIEEIEAQNLEQQGYVVIRAFTRGCPDLIAFRPEAAGMIIAREIKTKRDQLSPEQKLVIEYLKSQGVDAHVHRSDGIPNKPAKVRMTSQQREHQERPWVDQGYNSLKSGLTLDHFLSGVTKRSAAWYRMKAAFNHGRDQAIHESLKTWKPAI